MIKTKLVGLDVIVNDRELKVGDKVLMKTVTGTDGHNKIFEILGVKKGIQGIRNSYYVVKTDNETELRGHSCDDRQCGVAEAHESCAG